MWGPVLKNYTINKYLGEGAFGTVVSATNNKTGQSVAIKMIKRVQADSYMARKVLRELIILRKLGQLDNNLFFTKVYDIILPEGVLPSDDESKETKSTEADDIDIKPLKCLYVVMEEMEFDLKKMLDIKGLVLDEDHVTTIIYNALCAIKLLHSCDVIHRDIKPSNILIDENSSVKICDFGIARVIPKKTELESKL
mgnify:CR=1 FL=1|jgi:mitogen-activated protein kinase 1/3